MSRLLIHILQEIHNFVQEMLCSRPKSLGFLLNQVPTFKQDSFKKPTMQSNYGRNGNRIAEAIPQVKHYLNLSYKCDLLRLLPLTLTQSQIRSESVQKGSSCYTCKLMKVNYHMCNPPICRYSICNKKLMTFFYFLPSKESYLFKRNVDLTHNIFNSFSKFLQ